MQNRNTIRKQIGRPYLTGFKALAILACATIMTLPTPARAATRNESGIATSATLIWMKPNDLERRLQDIDALGATWVRVDFSWPAIQPTDADTYDWEKYDRLVEASSAHGLKILAMVAYTPAWARDPACAAAAKNEQAAQKCEPRDPEEFGHFAGAIAHHFAGKNIRGWEIWNEPNLSGYWKSAQSDGKLYVDPLAYARIANAAAWNIRQFNSDCAIVTGGLSPMFEPRYPKGMRQSDYLGTVLPHLEKDLFTGIGIHPYSWPVLPTLAADYNAFYTVDNGDEKYNLRTVMEKNGWDTKEIWATEYGASTEGLRATRTRWARPDHVTESQQAAIISDGVEAWYHKRNVGPLFVHSDTDEQLEDHSNEGGFGMRRPDGSKKPAYDQYKQAVLDVGVGRQ